MKKIIKIAACAMLLTLLCTIPISLQADTYTEWSADVQNLIQQKNYTQAISNVEQSLTPLKALIKGLPKLQEASRTALINNEKIILSQKNRQALNNALKNNDIASALAALNAVIASRKQMLEKIQAIQAQEPEGGSQQEPTVSDNYTRWFAGVRTLLIAQNYEEAINKTSQSLVLLKKLAQGLTKSKVSTDALTALINNENMTLPRVQQNAINNALAAGDRKEAAAQLQKVINQREDTLAGLQEIQARRNISPTIAPPSTVIPSTTPAPIAPKSGKMPVEEPAAAPTISLEEWIHSKLIPVLGQLVDNDQTEIPKETISALWKDLTSRVSPQEIKAELVQDTKRPLSEANFDSWLEYYLGGAQSLRPMSLEQWKEDFLDEDIKFAVQDKQSFEVFFKENKSKLWTSYSMLRARTLTDVGAFEKWIHTLYLEQKGDEESDEDQYEKWKTQIESKIEKTWALYEPKSSIHIDPRKNAFLEQEAPKEWGHILSQCSQTFINQKFPNGIADFKTELGTIYTNIQSKDEENAKKIALSKYETVHDALRAELNPNTDDEEIESLVYKGEITMVKYYLTSLKSAYPENVDPYLLMLGLDRWFLIDQKARLKKDLTNDRESKVQSSRSVPPKPKNKIVKYQSSIGKYEKAEAPGVVLRDLPRYKNLIMIVDNGGENSASALTTAFIYATYEQAAPILVSKNVVHNYLNIANDPNSMRKDEAGLLPSFHLSQWVIYEQGFFYLFIPKGYIKSVSSGFTQEQHDGIQALVAEGSWSGSEIILGLNLSKGVNIVKIENKDALKAHAASSLTTSGSLWDMLKLFFIPLTPTQLEKDNSSWVIYLEGHGSGGTNPDVAGLPFKEFISFIEFLSSKVKTSFLYYITCFGGGRAFRLVKEEFQNKEELFFNTKKPKFIIAVGALSDVSAQTRMPRLSATHDSIIKFAIDFPNFFASVRQYLNATLKTPKGKDPLSTIFDHLEQDPLNTPSVWIPSSGFSKAIGLKAEKYMGETTIAITQALVDAKAFTNEEISLEDQIGLLYAQEIPVTLKLSSQSSLLSMDNERIHLMRHVIFDSRALKFQVFYGGTSVLAQEDSSKKFEPTLLLIKRWNIEENYDRGALMFVVIAGAGVKACLYEKGGNYYTVNDFTKTLGTLNTVSSIISREAYIQEINKLVAQYRFRSPLLNLFSREIQIPPLLPSPQAYIKVIEQSLVARPYRDTDSNITELGQIVPQAEISNLQPLLIMPLDELARALTYNRRFIVKDLKSAPSNYVYASLVNIHKDNDLNDDYLAFTTRKEPAKILLIPFNQLSTDPTLVYLAPPTQKQGEAAQIYKTTDPSAPASTSSEKVPITQPTTAPTATAIPTPESSAPTLPAGLTDEEETMSINNTLLFQVLTKLAKDVGEPLREEYAKNFTSYERLEASEPKARFLELKKSWIEWGQKHGFQTKTLSFRARQKPEVVEQIVKQAKSDQSNFLLYLAARFEDRDFLDLQFSRIAAAEPAPTIAPPATVIPSTPSAPTESASSATSKPGKMPAIEPQQTTQPAPPTKEQAMAMEHETATLQSNYIEIAQDYDDKRKAYLKVLKTPIQEASTLALQAKSAYGKAGDLYVSGVNDRKNNNYQDAINKFMEAIPLFKKAIKDHSEAAQIYTPTEP